MRRETGAVLAETVPTEGNEAQPPNVTDKKPLTIPSFPRASNQWGYTGSRFQRPNGAYAITDAKTYEERLELSRKLPLPKKRMAIIFPPKLCAMPLASSLVEEREQ